MIPVIGIPYLSRPELLAALLDSIPRDMVERIHIIDNSPPPGIVEIEGFKHAVVTRMHHNAGVAASWNAIIKLNPRARWWCLLNSDVTVSRGTLEALEQAMKVHSIAYMSAMAAFGLRADCVQKVGWFDENYVPAYHEDNDYDYRCRLMGVHIEDLALGIEHFGSAVLKGSEHYQRENGRTFGAGRAYHREKWGGDPGFEVYQTPFDQGGSPRDWTLDMTRLANLSWTWEET